jgi:dienelactone hydrolase
MQLIVLALCIMTAAIPVRAAAALVEEVIEIPVTVSTIYNQAVSQNITVTIWRDDSRAKAPFLVLNHGRPATRAAYPTMGRQRYSANSAYFVSKGFVVLIPTRVGYGPSGGTDVEYAGPCAGRLYPPVFKAAAQQTLALLKHAKTLPYVDTNRGLVVGQSFGGATAIALASMNPEGVIAVVNFSGGSGGNPESSPEQPCKPELLEKTFADYGRTAKVPTLWLYSENDRYFGNVFPKKWFEAFAASGGQASFVEMPPFKNDGHTSFTGNPAVWKPAFEEFIKAVGFQ